MDTSLYDPELDGVPPIVGAVRPSDPKAAILGKKIGGPWREHPFVEWVLGLSLPGLIAVSISIGVLVSTPLLIALGSDSRGFLLLLGLLLPAPVLWAIRNREIPLPRWPRSPNFQRPARVKPTTLGAVGSRRHLSLDDLCPPGPPVDPASRERFLWLTASNQRAIGWCAACPFLMYFNLAVSSIVFMALYWVPYLLGDRYGPPEPGSLPSLLLSLMTGLHGAAVILAGIAWVMVNGLIWDLYLIAVLLCFVVGPFVTLRSLVKEGLTGWDRPISILLAPMLRLSLFWVATAERMIGAACRLAWWLVGWSPSIPGKAIVPGELPDAPALCEAAQSRRLFPLLTDITRGRILAALTFLLITMAINASTVVICLVERITGPSRDRLANGSPVTLEIFSVGFFLVGLSYGLAHLVIGIRGPRADGKGHGKPEPVIP